MTEKGALDQNTAKVALLVESLMYTPDLKLFPICHEPNFWAMEQVKKQKIMVACGMWTTRNSNLETQLQGQKQGNRRESYLITLPIWGT